MATKLIIDGNAVYEIDEDCLEYKRGSRRKSSAGSMKPGKGAGDGKTGTGRR